MVAKIVRRHAGRHLPLLSRASGYLNFWIGHTMPRTRAEVLWETWNTLSYAERVRRFKLLPTDQRDEFFLSLDPREQAQLLTALPSKERRLWVRLLEPDDATDLVQEAAVEERGELLSMLDEPTRAEVRALLTYAEDVAGGLMNPRYVHVRPDMTVGEAVRYVRHQAGTVETIYYVYILDASQRLLGVCSLRELFQGKEDQPVRDVMHPEPVTVSEHSDQETVARLYVEQDLLAIPVVDDQQRMRGIITFDDVADVVREEATEDIQMAGGTQALEEPYLSVSLPGLVKKRALWLTVLFLGEMLTASAMTFYEGEIASAVVLALFLPMIISSGGNAGSQATTLVIRAMALGQVRLLDWWRVLRRELAAGMLLGLVLAAFGMIRVVAWQAVGAGYGEHYVLLGLTVSVSVLGVVVWGSLAGSMLPIVLRSLRLDPAAASAPLVATMVDVTGVVIYFSVASTVLSGTLL